MIYECLVYQTVATRCWIDTTEVPVAQMVGARIVQAFKALEYKFQFSFQVNRFQKVGYFARNLIGCEWVVDCTCAVYLLGIGFA